MRSAEKGTVRLDIPSSIQMLEMADALVSQLTTAAGFEPDSVQDIQIAVHEAVVNAIVHGNRWDETRRVTLELAVLPGRLDVRVRDEGLGFDPISVPDPLTPGNLSKSSGRGILLMRRLMNEVAFHRPASGGTEVTMLKRISPSEKSALESAVANSPRVRDARAPVDPSLAATE